MCGVAKMINRADFIEKCINAHSQQIFSFLSFPLNNLIDFLYIAHTALLLAYCNNLMTNLLVLIAAAKSLNGKYKEIIMIRFNLSLKVLMNL